MKQTFVTSACLSLFSIALAAHGQLVFSILPSSANGGYSANLNAVNVAGDTLTAVAANSSILTAMVSSNVFDPASWSSSTVSAPGGLNAVTYGGGFFLASGGNNLIFTSPDGVTWSNRGRAFGAGSTFTTKGLAYIGTNFVLAPSTVAIKYSAPTAVASVWKDANIVNAAFLESYRAVAPFGSNSFALCGTHGVIRISKNDGITWTAANPYDFKKPDYFSVATDGKSNLVCVGASGVIQYSMDGGVSWLSSTNPGGPSTLNAVTYAGNGRFVAAGDGGTVVLSSDGGQTWTPQTLFLAGQSNNPSAYAPTNFYQQFASGFSTALRGGALANSGSLTGLVFLVGDNGQVLVGGDIPAAPTNPVSQTNYAGYVSSNLQVTVAAPYITADWYDSNSMQLVATNTTSFTPPTVPNWPGLSEVTSNYVVFARDTRTGLISTNGTPVELVLRPRPTSMITSSDTTNCNYGLPYTIQINLTGIQPWTVVWWDGAVSNYNSITAARIVYPTNELPNLPTDHFYFVTNLLDAFSNQIGTVTYTNLPGDLLGTNRVTINPRPAATLVSLDSTVCNYGAPYTIQANLTGLGNWDVTWWDGAVSNYTASVGTTGVAVRVVYPTNALPNLPMSHQYWILGVTNANDCVACGNACTNWASDLLGTNTVTVNPRPTAFVYGTNTVCNYGLPYTIQATLTGLTNWNVTWWDGAVSNYTAAFGANGIATRTIYPTNLLANYETNYQYWIAGVTNINGCVECGGFCTNWNGDLTGTNLLTVNPRPTATLVSIDATNCNDGSSFTVQATLTGLTNWNVTWWDGAVSNYMAAYGVSGMASRAVYPTNLLANTATNYLYWIAGVTNITDCVACGGGCTNWATDILGTNTVTINPRPTVQVLGTNTLCTGDSYGITNLLTGIGPWTITWASNGVQVMEYVTNLLNGGAGPFTNLTLVYPTNAPNYGVATNLFYVVGLNASGCPAQAEDISGVATLIVDPVMTNAPEGMSVTTCTNVAVALTVSVPTGFTADWYSDAGLTALVTSSVTNYTPPLPNVSTNYYVVGRFNDPNLVSPCYSPVTNLTVTAVDCTNEISSVTLDPNGIVLQWSGNFILLHSTNLAPPYWMHVTQGGVGPNVWTNLIQPAPASDFFQLWSPTNWPYTNWP